jgi:hypothetical protein
MKKGKIFQVATSCAHAAYHMSQLDKVEVIIVKSTR